jgi:serine/threonine-protein kinase
MDAGARPPPSAGRGVLYGIGAFLGIAIIGGVGGYFVLFQNEEAPAGKRVPVVVERASSIVDTAKPPEPAPGPKAADPAPEPVKVVKPPRRLAVTEPPKPAESAPVVVVREPPKVEPPKPAPTVTAKGELELRIRPWAKVEVDGREIGVTPLDAPLLLSAGDHQVRLVNPDLGKDITRTVHITASEKEVLKEILDE